jgi:molybdopterin molybdotransferase
MLTVADAEKRVLRHAPAFGEERVAVADAAGRVLAETIRADRDYPPYDRSKMDGIAFAFAAWKKGVRSFRVERTVQAGEPGGRLRNAANGCVRIMTGAEVPAGCTCVVPREEVVAADDHAACRAEHVEPDQFIHRRGSDRAKGAVLLTPGQVLDGPRISVAVSAGKAVLRVARLPRIAIVSSGDELVELGRPVKAWQIRPSNIYGIHAALRLWGLQDVQGFHAPDDRAALRRAMKRALAFGDVVITTGGVSEGDVDFMPEIARELGARQIFHKVSQRPGKPLWFGRAGSKRVFGLPGNPVSTLVCLRRYVLSSLAGPSASSVPLLAPITSSEKMTYFIPVVLTGLGARPVRYGGSGDLAALSSSDGFVELPPRKGMYRKGERVAYFGWNP